MCISTGIQLNYRTILAKEDEESTMGGLKIIEEEGKMDSPMRNEHI